MARGEMIRFMAEIGVTKQVRKAIGKTYGDTVAVTITERTGESIK